MAEDPPAQSEYDETNYHDADSDRDHDSNNRVVLDGRDEILILIAECPSKAHNDRGPNRRGHSDVCDEPFVVVS
mgnify:CR=1 FL=1